MTPEEALSQYFGYDSFRGGQKALIDAVLSGCDALGVMPTGGGKSLCYQLPALLLDGLTVVVSPLISLMADQVSSLQSAGISAAFLNSSLTFEEAKRVFAGARRGKYRLLYAAPERLESEGFCNLLYSLPVSLVAVDEAHCVSQWGQDFRPSYLSIADFIEDFPVRPVVAAFTATATEDVRRDIARLLRLRDPKTVVTGFDRPNLRFEVMRPADKDAALLSLLKDRKQESGIVYCATRNAVDSVCRMLCRAGFSASRYHAGLSDAERKQNQEDFLYDRCTVMAATNAFGMGIDKSNVSFVIHYNMPKSMEAYYQEAGRAGRDGSPAECILFYAPRDVVTARFLIEHSDDDGQLPPEKRAAFLRKEKKRLNDMVAYCCTDECLRAYILRYFGQTAEENCQNCSNCLANFETQDITIPAQMILSSLYRSRRMLGYDTGAAVQIDCLRGSRASRVMQLGLDALPTYGLMKDIPLPQVRQYFELLEKSGHLCRNPQHETIVPVEAAAARVLKQKQPVIVSVRKEEAPVLQSMERRRAASSIGEEKGLYPVLRRLRLAIAQEEHVPAYVIFSNATLADMAEKEPVTTEEFLSVSGVGEAKCARYGERFLKAIRAYRETNSDGF